MAAAICSAASSGLAQQSIATWWVNGQTNLPPPNPFTNNTASLYVVVGPMTKGAGIGEPSGTAEYGGNSWTNDVVGGSGATDTEANAIAGGHYLTYSIQAAPGYTVSFSTNLMYYHVSATGPGHGELQYSTDGINYTDISPMNYAGGSGGSAATTFMTNNLSGIAALQNVPATVTNFFRVVNWGATASGGTWYIYDNPPAGTPAGTNGFAVLGAVTQLPASESVATWWSNPLANGGGAPPAAFTNNTADPNVVVTAMTKGSGIGAITTSGVYGGNAWTNDAVGGSGTTDTEANAIAGGHYVTYAIQAAAGYTVSFYTNVLYYHNSATGPINGELQYSTDGVNYVNLVPMTYATSSTAETLVMTNGLANFSQLLNVPATVTNFFRIVNWGATGPTGTWYVDDNPPAGTPLGTNGFAVIGGVTSLNGVVAPTNLVISPLSIAANAGQTVSFNVSASGSPATVLWYQMAGTTPVLVPSATSPTLTLSNVLGANAGSYYAVLANSAGSATSSVVTLTVADPFIQVEPSSVQGLVDGTVQFAVTVAGTAPAYQWYFSDASGNILSPVANGTQADGSVVAGATGSVLSISKLPATETANFVVVAANSHGSVTSTVASFLSGNNPPGTVAYTDGVLALWDFDGIQFTNTAVNPNCLLSPAPFIGTGVASVVGTPYNPGTSPFSGATDPNDVGYDANEGGWVFTPFGFEQPSPNFSWGTEDYPVTGTNKANGVQFNVSTVGAKNIQIAYDSRVSATASDYERLQYTTNGTTWIDYPASSTFSGLYGSGNAGYYTFTYSLVGFPGVDNNPNFGIRVVTEYQSTATYGVGTTNNWVGTANSYTSGASGNNAAGTVTYDLVAITGDAVTNNNVAPELNLVNLPMSNGLAVTNMVDTNTLTLNFTASSAQMPASLLKFNVQTVDTVAAGQFSQTVNPTFSVGNTGSTNFQLSISFPGNYIPDPLDAAPVLITATDTNGETSAAWFLLTVGAINQPPTNSLTTLGATNTLANTPLVIPFTVGSARDGYTNLTYSVASDNNTVIPPGNIVVTGNTNTGAMILTVTPANGGLGNALISVTVNDNDPDEPRSTTANLAVIVRPNRGVVAIDYFNYDNSGALDSIAAGYWQHLSGVNHQLQAGGGLATVSDGNTENVQAQLLGSPYKTNSGAVLYTSFTVNMNPSTLPTGEGSYFAAFNDGSGNTADVEDCLVAATNGAADGFYRLGIANVVGATAASAQMFPVDLTPGVTYFVVTSLTLTNGYSTLWVSPTNPAAQSVTDTTPPATPTNLYNIVNFELRESGATEGSINVGNVLVGQTFDSVFYPPQANPDSFAVTENTTNTLAPLGNDAGSALTLVSVTPDANGTATISGTNVVFKPVSDFLGTATIGYTVQDDVGNTSSSTMTVTVTNRPPLANAVSFTVAENSANNPLNPLASDAVETPGGTLGLVSVTPDANGTATISGTSVLFTPNPNFVGTANLGYTITDNIGGTSSSTIAVTVGTLSPIPLSTQYANGKLAISWTNPAFSLQFSTNVAGPYVTIPAAASPYNAPMTNTTGFYRLVH